MREARLDANAQTLTMIGTQLMPMSESATANVRCIREAEGRALTLDDGAAVDGVGVAGHAAGDGNGRAARADGDVQAAEHHAEERAEDTLSGGVEAARVFDVLAALRSTGRRATRARTVGHGGHSAHESKGGEEGLGEHSAEEAVQASSAGDGCSSLRQHLTRDLMSHTR
jgi:hypothetical protein